MDPSASEIGSKRRRGRVPGTTNLRGDELWSKYTVHTARKRSRLLTKVLQTRMRSTDLLDSVEEVSPCIADDWNRVADTFNEGKAVGEQRTAQTLRLKCAHFAMLGCWSASTSEF